MENTKKIVEINGVKIEVDLRNAKVIENYKVGDNVKVLVKEYSTYESYVGVIIGFDDFKETPTILIAYLKTDYRSAEIKYLAYNSHLKDVEITALNEFDIPLTKSEVIKEFDNQTKVKELELKETIKKKEVFEKLFGKYFEQH
jgi:hypothetical protein